MFANLQFLTVEVVKGAVNAIWISKIFFSKVINIWQIPYSKFLFNLLQQIFSYKSVSIMISLGIELINGTAKNV